jgi:Calcineurin-like phosphoesterase
MSAIAPEAEVRGPLPDDALVVFVSDTHIGGSDGADIFESADDLTALIVDLDRHDGPVELVLVGDIFDLQRMGGQDSETDRIAATIARGEYRGLFESLRAFANASDHHVVYVVGNHDAEIWSNPQVRRSLETTGLVDEIALSYATRFASAPDRLIYCEHGNQLDPANRITDYANPLDTPMGAHIVTELVRPIGSGAAVTSSLDLRDVNYVFPIGEIPEWVAGRIFYQFLSQAVRWLLTPLIALGIVAGLLGGSGDGSMLRRLLVGVVFGLALIVVALGAFGSVGSRVARQAIEVTARTPFGRAIAAKRYRADESVGELLRAGRPAPMASNIPGNDIAVWISGHTHAPSMTELSRPDGRSTVMANTGCWLRQLVPIEAWLGAPSVFVPVVVQTHVRVRAIDGVTVELWEHPKPAERRLRWIDPLRIVPKRPGPADRRLQWIEWLAIAGRMPKDPPAGAEPRLVARRELTR